MLPELPAPVEAMPVLAADVLPGPVVPVEAPVLDAAAVLDPPDPEPDPAVEPPVAVDVVVPVPVPVVWPALALAVKLVDVSSVEPWAQPASPKIEARRLTMWRRIRAES
ncbi:MAG: hypothetical protein D6705_13095 [Deltaproteobacteria bacterium]|nr:MAG: hypothetical protein D6705_13095 [Deltaproteobacteria bacterium]